MILSDKYDTHALIHTYDKYVLIFQKRKLYHHAYNPLVLPLRLVSQGHEMLRYTTHLNCSYNIHMTVLSAAPHAKRWYANLKIRFTTQLSNVNITHLLLLVSVEVKC